MKNNIIEIKKRNGMTYEDIAKIARVSVSYIWQLANGKKKNPSYSVMERIAFALQSTIEKVFKLKYRAKRTA